jgi:hypothetical protein
LATEILVEPTDFEVVDYDAATIRGCAAEVVRRVGIADEPVIRINVDERSMLSQTRLVSLEPIVIEVLGGAFEDKARPRQLSKPNIVDELARVLQRVADRRDASFAGAPPEDELTLEQAAALDVHCWGRSTRWQAVSFRARHHYDFSLACGFSPDVDLAFNGLWDTESLGWAGVAGLTPAAAPRRAATRRR